MSMSVHEARMLSKTSGLAGPDPVGAGLRFVGLCAGFALFAFLGLVVDTTPLWLAVSVVNGLLMFGVAIGGHEATHGNLSKNRQINDLVGVAWMSLILLPFGMYCRMHTEHHAWVNTDKDPEGNYVYKNLWSFLVLSAFFGASFIVVVWGHTILASLGRSSYVRTPRQRRRITVQGLLSAVLCGGLIVATILFPVMRWVWFAPMLVGVFWWAPLILTPEHYALGPGDPAATSRTTKSNGLVRTVLWNVDFHAAHHIAPGVPARKLPEFHAMIEPDTLPETTTGYLRFQLKIMGALLRRRPMLIPQETGQI